MFFMGSPRGCSCERSISYALLLRQNPLHQRVHVRVRDRGVRRHGHVAPDPLASLFYLLGELGRRFLVRAVFGRHVLVGRADHLLVHRMAGKAGVLLREFVASPGGENCKHAEGECCALHVFSLRIFLKFSRSSMGARQLTPRHSHALTFPGRAGLSSSAGRPAMPSGIPRTRVSAMYSRASSACQSRIASSVPRSTSVFGCARCSSSAKAIMAKPPG